MEFKLPYASEGKVAYITDVHGEADLLLEAINNIRDPKNTRFIFGGDAVDRGEQNKQVLSILRELERGDHFKEVVLLGGNHEQIMFGALAGELGIPLGHSEDYQGQCTGTWIMNGGANTLEEFRSIENPKTYDFQAAYDALPEQIIKRMRGDLPNYVEDGDLLFVHAGIDKRMDAAAFLAKDGRDLCTGPLWIRGEFLFDKTQAIGPRGNTVLVVHGHTRMRAKLPAAMMEEVRTGIEKFGRLSLDTTGSGFLSLAQIEGDMLDLTIIGPDGPEPDDRDWSDDPVLDLLMGR